MNNLILEKTEDGSDTFFIPTLDEHYHSTKGALTEAEHIFINSGLLFLNKKNINVLEIGFGTGLNAIKTLEATQEEDLIVNYTTLELHPLNLEQVAELNFMEKPFYKELHEAEWGKEVEVIPNFKITKLKEDFTKFHASNYNQTFDVIYFDAFGPEKQPEMWTQQLFDHLYVLLNSGGVLTTYSAKGAVRRMLQTTGFTVERIPGPPGGKREIIRAIKNA